VVVFLGVVAVAVPQWDAGATVAAVVAGVRLAAVSFGGAAAVLVLATVAS